MSTRGAPSARAGAAGVWTGRYLVVYGGDGASSFGGGIYDPCADSWRAMSVRGLPVLTSTIREGAQRIGLALRTLPVPTVIGQRLIFFGDAELASSAPTGNLSSTLPVHHIFDPKTNTWKELAKGGRPEHGGLVVASSERLAVLEPPGPEPSAALGAIYDVDSNRWDPIDHDATATLPAAGAWVAERLVVLGNRAVAMYEPKQHLWRTFETPPVFTSGAMLVPLETYLVLLSSSSDWLLEPDLGTWHALATRPVPWEDPLQGEGGRSPFSSPPIWTGTHLVFFDPNLMYPSRCRRPGSYALDPITNRWSEIRTESAGGRPHVRDGKPVFPRRRGITVLDLAASSHEVSRFEDPPDEAVEANNPVEVWTGSRLLVWGGYRGARVGTEPCAPVSDPTLSSRHVRPPHYSNEGWVYLEPSP